MGIGAYSGVQYSKAYVANPPTMIHASYFGKTITMVDTAETLAGYSDTGSTFTMFRPPAGARWNGVGAVWSDALTSANLAVGLSATVYARTNVIDVNWADKTAAIAVVAAFGAATSHDAAVKTELGLAANINYVGYEFDGETNVVITTSGTGPMATGATVTLTMEFIVA